MADGDLTSTQAVRGFLGLKTSDDDALLDALVTAVSGWITAYLSRPVVATSMTDVFDGTRTNSVCLSRSPVISVSSVSMSGQDIPAATRGGVDAGYLLDKGTGRIVFRGYNFSKYPGSLSVDFIAGWSTVPAELAQAATEIVAFRFKERLRWGQDSASNAGQTVSFSPLDIPRAAKTVLDQYRRVAPT